MMLTLLFLAIQPAAAATAPSGAPARIVQESRGLGNYLSEPEAAGPDSYRAWSWSVVSNRLSPDGVDAFLNVYHCRTGTFQRLRHERYRSGRLASANRRAQSERRPTTFEMEERQLAEICSGSVRRLETVPSIAVARERIRAAR